MRCRLLAGFVCLALAGCQQSPTSDQFGSGRGHYIGVGIYAPGRMWRQITRSGQADNGTSATLGDDEQVIVVLDAATGEVRQCGNLSGFCVAMNPWKAPAARVPTTLAKHAGQLDQEEAGTAR